MSIKIYNTQTQKKEDFQPLTEGQVKMYVCGPTVYDLLHVGNFRGPIFFNVVRNWFEKNNFSVQYIYNYTDVDDKIIHRAQEEGVESSQISEKYIAEFEKDYKSLKLKPHTKNPRVTEHIKDIIQFIGDLIEQNKTYEIEGDVYYSVPNFSEYGKLSNKNLEDMESGSRIEVDERKKHPSDFALWKSVKEEKGARWPSPWGEGRPGWHIECSAMTYALLGETIDIHGGGLDLVFPHHENELAQSEGRTGKPYVRYWMHNNMIEFGSQKMSKSLGNIRTARAFLEQYDGEILKYMMLMAHYRSPIDFSETQVGRAMASLAKFYSALALAKRQIAAQAELVPVNSFQKVIDRAHKGFAEALNDDFNTAEALARLFEVLRAYNTQCCTPGPVTPQKKAISEVFYHWLRNQSEVLALFQEEPEDYLIKLDNKLLERRGLSRLEIDRLVQERGEARKNKDYGKADEIRDQLVKWGISVMDSPEGNTWEVEKS